MRNLLIGLGIVGLLSAGASAQGRRYHRHQNYQYNNGAYYNNYNNGYSNYNNGYNTNYHQPINGTYNWANGNPYQNGNGNGNYYYPNNGYYYNNGYQYNAAGQVINGLLNRRW